MSTVSEILSKTTRVWFFSMSVPENSTKKDGCSNDIYSYNQFPIGNNIYSRLTLQRGHFPISSKAFKKNTAAKSYTVKTRFLLEIFSIVIFSCNFETNAIYRNLKYSPRIIYIIILEKGGKNFFRFWEIIDSELFSL